MRSKGPIIENSIGDDVDILYIGAFKSHVKTYLLTSVLWWAIP